MTNTFGVEKAKITKTKKKQKQATNKTGEKQKTSYTIKYNFIDVTLCAKQEKWYVKS